MIPQSDIDKFNENKQKKKTISYQQTWTTIFFLSFNFYILMIIYLFNDIFPILLGWYLSDFFSGLFHIYFDNRITTRITNTHEELIYSFQYIHHINPKEFINNHSIFACGGEPGVLKLSFGLFLLLYFISDNTSYKLMISTFSLGNSVSQVNHGFSHMNYNELNIIIKFLQKSKIILSNEEHNKHHIKGQLKYAIVNGWSNPLLDYLFIYHIQPLMNQYPQFFKKQKLILDSKILE